MTSSSKVGPTSRCGHETLTVRTRSSAREKFFFFVRHHKLVIHLGQTCLGACRVIPVNVAQIPRPDTLAISIVRMDLAPWGPPWSTSSVCRSVYWAGPPSMKKLGSWSCMTRWPCWPSRPCSTPNKRMGRARPRSAGMRHGLIRHLYKKGLISFAYIKYKFIFKVLLFLCKLTSLIVQLL